MSDGHGAAPTARLQPARGAIAGRWAVTAIGLAVLLVGFVAAVVTLPTAAATGIAAVLAGVGLWLGRRVSAAAQAGLLATTEGLVVRLGTASAELGWRAVETLALAGAGRRVAVQVRADHLQRDLPAVFAATDARRWLSAAAELAAQAGRDDLQLTDDALITAPGSSQP